MNNDPWLRLPPRWPSVILVEVAPSFCLSYTKPSGADWFTPYVSRYWPGSINIPSKVLAGFTMSGRLNSVKDLDGRLLYAMPDVWCCNHHGKILQKASELQGRAAERSKAKAHIHGRDFYKCPVCDVGVWQPSNSTPASAILRKLRSVLYKHLPDSLPMPVPIGRTNVKECLEMLREFTSDNAYRQWEKFARAELAQIEAPPQDQPAKPGKRRFRI